MVDRQTHNRKSIMERLARRVRQLRSAQGLTQEALAQRSGLAPRHIQKVEAAVLNITLDSLVKLAEALDVDVGDLLTQESSDTRRRGCRDHPKG